MADTSSRDIVTYFGQEMTRDWAEMLEASQKETHYRKDQQLYERISYGSESFRDPAEAETQPCRHCSTIKGKLHEPGCEYEQCPDCGDSIMNCECEFIGHEWRNVD